MVDDVEIATHHYDAGAEGNLIVTTTVENRSAEEQRRVLRVRIETDDGPEERTKEVTLPAGGHRTVNVSFDVPTDRFDGGEDAVAVSLDGGE
ncbi:MAG: hypothetical protein ABEJ28_08620 [Salinigranum sp.]